jgi:hypothetical protein
MRIKFRLSFFAVLASSLISVSIAGEFAGTCVRFVCACGCDSQILSTGSDVIEAENQNFQKKVIDNGSLTLVSFYAPWLAFFFSVNLNREGALILLVNIIVWFI